MSFDTYVSLSPQPHRSESSELELAAKLQSDEEQIRDALNAVITIVESAPLEVGMMMTLNERTREVHELKSELEEIRKELEKRPRKIQSQVMCSPVTRVTFDGFASAAFALCTPCIAHERFTCRLTGGCACVGCT